MLTYQLQDRILHVDPGNTLTFPNLAEILVHLGPPEVFGTSDAPSRVFVHGSQVSFTFQGTTGRVLFESSPPLGALKAELRDGDSKLLLQGDELRCSWSCQSVEELVGAIRRIQYFLPPLLNLVFPEPPFISFIGGNVAGVEFRWIHSHVQHAFRPLSAASLQEAFLLSVDQLKLAQRVSHARLTAATHYIHVASRLLVAGVSEWEFMPECVLNFHKALQVLFGNHRDDVRNELAKLGYSTREVESDFIPLMLLRDQLDVGHPRLAIPKIEQLDVVYGYLLRTEISMKGLVARVFERAKAGAYVIREAGEMQFAADEQRSFDKLVASMAARPNACENPSP